MAMMTLRRPALVGAAMIVNTRWPACRDGRGALCAARAQPERSDKQHQQQLGQKASVDSEQAGSVDERERPKAAPNGTNR